MCVTTSGKFLLFGLNTKICPERIKIHEEKKREYNYFDVAQVFEITVAKTVSEKKG